MVSAHDPLEVNPSMRQADAVDLETQTAHVAEDTDCPVPEFLFTPTRTQKHRRLDAPADSCPSSRNDKGIRERADDFISPVKGQGATTFSSVASTLDFQHHLGSDPAAELLVLKRILLRECMLYRLEADCGDIRRRSLRHTMLCERPETPPVAITEGVIQLMSRIREATAAVIEAIVAWRGNMNQHPPPAFLWHGENYLLRVTNDLNFLGGVESLSAILKKHPACFCRNPLMLPKTLDEQRRNGELLDGGDGASSPRLRRREHYYRVAKVLLDEEDFQRERETIQQESPTITADRPRSHGESRPSESTLRVDPEMDDDKHLRRRQLSTWYEEARSQLISLSRCSADEEYFLHSRRFWSKKELRDNKGFIRRSPPPPQHPSVFGCTTPHALGESLSEGGGESHETAIRRRKGFDKDRTGWLEKVPQNTDTYGQATFGTQRGLAHSEICFHSRQTDAASTHGSKAGARGDKSGHRAKFETDVWSRPEEKNGDPDKGKPPSLASLTTQDIQSLLKEETPPPATIVVCAAIVFLLAPDDQVPEDFHWPLEFEKVALPAEDFLKKLHEISGRTISSFKARVLKFVMQRKDMLPADIERQGGHAVACLCAWALEELRDYREFDDWSHLALEAWYEMQRPRTREQDIPREPTLGPGATLFYKSLHRLADVGSSYVLSLFKDLDGSGGVLVRAFDLASFETFWLALSDKQITSFGGNATRSPTHLAAMLARRLKVTVGSATSSRRLIMPPIKTLELRKKKIRSRTKYNGVKTRGGDSATGDFHEAKSLLLPLPTTKSTTISGNLQRHSGQVRRSPPISERGSNKDDIIPQAQNDGKGMESTLFVGKNVETPLGPAVITKKQMTPVVHRELRMKEAQEIKIEENPSLDMSVRDPSTGELAVRQGRGSIIRGVEEEIRFKTSEGASKWRGEDLRTKHLAPWALEVEKTMFSEGKRSRAYADDLIDDGNGTIQTGSDADDVTEGIPSGEVDNRGDGDTISADVGGHARGSSLDILMDSKDIPVLPDLMSDATEKVRFSGDLDDECVPSSPTPGSIPGGVGRGCAVAREALEQQQQNVSVEGRSDTYDGRSDKEYHDGAVLPGSHTGQGQVISRRDDEEGYDFDEEDFEDDDSVDFNRVVSGARVVTSKTSDRRKSMVYIDGTGKAKPVDQKPVAYKREEEIRVTDKSLPPPDEYSAALSSLPNDRRCRRSSSIETELSVKDAAEIGAESGACNAVESNNKVGGAKGSFKADYQSLLAVQTDDERQNVHGHSSLEMRYISGELSAKVAALDFEPTPLATKITDAGEILCGQDYPSEFEESPSDDPSESLKEISPAASKSEVQDDNDAFTPQATTEDVECPRQPMSVELKTAPISVALVKLEQDLVEPQTEKVTPEGGGQAGDDKAVREEGIKEREIPTIENSDPGHYLKEGGDWTLRGNFKPREHAENKGETVAASPTLPPSQSKEEQPQTHAVGGASEKSIHCGAIVGTKCEAPKYIETPALEVYSGSGVSCGVSEQIGMENDVNPHGDIYNPVKEIPTVPQETPGYKLTRELELKFEKYVDKEGRRGITAAVEDSALASGEERIAICNLDVGSGVSRRMTNFVGSTERGERPGHLASIGNLARNSLEEMRDNSGLQPEHTNRKIMKTEVRLDTSAGTGFAESKISNGAAADLVSISSTEVSRQSVTNPPEKNAFQDGFEDVCKQTLAGIDAIELEEGKCACLKTIPGSADATPPVEGILGGASDASDSTKPLERSEVEVSSEPPGEKASADACVRGHTKPVAQQELAAGPTAMDSPDVENVLN